MPAISRPVPIGCEETIGGSGRMALCGGEVCVDDGDQVALGSGVLFGGPAHDDLVAVGVLADDLDADLSAGVQSQCRKLAHRLRSLANAGALGKGSACSASR